MGNLIRTEWLKIRKYKAFWWMLGIIVITYPGINWIFFQIFHDVTSKNDPGSAVIKATLGNPFAFPEAWHTVAFASSLFVFIPSILIIMFISNEYTYKTHRQNIIDGWSRNEFMISKMIDVFIISVVITLAYLAITLIIGQLNSSDSQGSIFEQAKYIGLFFLQTFSQLSIAFLVAFLVRKAFIALGIFLFEFLIVENILSGLGRRFNFREITRFLPFEISDKMIPLPTFFSRIDPDSYKTALSQMNIQILYSVLLTTLIWFLCFRLNAKRDL